MSFLYPRVITISRMAQEVGVGAVGYGGASRATESVIASDVSASIQLKKDGRMPRADLPADPKTTEWRIFFKLPLGTVKTGDVITDDLGQRYAVNGPYWGPLGYNCLCERLGA